MHVSIDNNTTLSKTFVVGAESFIGSYVMMRFQGFLPDCSGSTHRENSSLPYIDLEKPDILPLKLYKNGYKYALLSAAVTAADKCEQNPAYSFSVNVSGTLELIRQLTAEGIVPIYLSSDYVFDGKNGNYSETSQLCPVNRYGEQKAAVERAIPEICGSKYIILRLSKMFSIDRNRISFLTMMIDDIISKKTIRAAYDQIFCPSVVEDLFTVIEKLQMQKLYGLFNVCSLQSISRYDLATQIAHICNVPADFIRRISIDDLNESFPRPHNTSLTSAKITALTGIRFTSINECIPLLLQNRSTENGKQ